MIGAGLLAILALSAEDPSVPQESVAAPPAFPLVTPECAEMQSTLDGLASQGYAVAMSGTDENGRTVSVWTQEQGVVAPSRANPNFVVFVAVGTTACRILSAGNVKWKPAAEPPKPNQ